MKPTLVIMAAGMGSRYGSLKQIDPVGPAGALIIHYSIYDALRAGFDKIVFVIKKSIDFVLQRADEMPILVELIAQGRLPVRVTHNDTKYNNVMIDNQSGEAICVIDLDTVMPGSLLYDFGDAIRSITNTATEDERDLSIVHFSLDTYEQYAQGYLAATRGALIPTELEFLAFSTRLMKLECGMRFLVDYLDGDIYFRTHRENHNLDRCRTQFKLVQEMETQSDTMEKMIKECVANW